MSAPQVRRSPTHTAQVVAVRDLTRRMRRVTVRGDTLVGLQTRPAQDVELYLREPSGRRVKRRYTIRAARPEVGELDLDVLLHGRGPGSSWAAGAAPGDTVQFQGPRGKLQLTSAGWHLLVGDESALPAIAAVCEALTEPTIAVVEVGDAGDELALSAAETHWVHRGAAPAGQPDLLAAALDALGLPPGLPPSSGHGYLMGETRAMVALRALLERRGLDHEAIFVKGYWNLGRPDRLAGRRPGEA